MLLETMVSVFVFALPGGDALLFSYVVLDVCEHQYLFVVFCV